MILLHGFLGSPASWDAITAAFPDADPRTLPGHLDEPPVLDFVDALRWMVQTIPEPVHLVGYSMGARIALGTAVAIPNRILSLTLIGGGVGLETVAAREARIVWEDDVLTRLRSGDFEAFLRFWRALPIFETQRRLDAARLELQDNIRRQHDPQTLADTFSALALSRMPNYWSRLANLTVPTNFVVGADDPKYVAIAERAVDLCPNATITVVPDAGHNVVLEQPEAVINAIANQAPRR